MSDTPCTENLAMDPPPDEFRNWLALPRDVTASILMRLEAFEILTSAQKVCSPWHNLCKDPSMWRAVHMRNPVTLWEFPYVLEKMCRHAVDRSCGQLVDIYVENFGTDELLRHIADRCYHISDKGLSEVAAKLPLLEELVISYCFLSKEALEAVGRCCSHLKSLKFNSRELWHLKYDEEALAIAQNMSELRRLQLFGNKLTNDGLQAILDGCPHLESLDLRECFNVSLAGNLGKRCSEQIKDLRHPHDSTYDYDYKNDERIYIEYFEDLDDFEVCDGPNY
ncbi:putative F-box/LRR-repeat protein 23 isoform X2 [Alnus glutinosa]|uniref:putative F-box/LRR-repeat protein 23 isoform X2 n=1 Tax=Alnus glutinosa TaxID=3517 RepID=UPI002D78B74C|nr:putative F-box/LRR-repeat protein 23 isoform X2 [Alnus glutinosa]